MNLEAVLQYLDKRSDVITVGDFPNAEDVPFVFVDRGLPPTKAG